MAGITRVVKYAEGATVSAPAQTFIQTSQFAQHASDGDFVTAKGSPAEEGDTYYNTTSDVIRLFKTGAWQTVQDQAAPIVTSDTTNATDKDTGSIITEGGVGIEQDVHIGGSLTVNTNATVTGDLTVNGTSTTINTATLDVEDNNITVNKGGNQASAADAGLSVEMSDASDVKLLYDGLTTSRMKVGDTGSEQEIATTGHSQTLTNKTINGNNNSLSNLEHGSEVDNPSSGVHGVTGSVVGTSDTQDISNKTFTDAIIMDGQGAHPATPATGDYKLYFLDSDNSLYYKDDAGTETKLASLDTSPPIRYARNVEVTVANNTLTYLDFNSQTFDDDSDVSGAGGGDVTTSGTGWRYIAPATGVYSVNASLAWNGQNWTGGEFIDLRIYRDGTLFSRLLFEPSSSNEIDLDTWSQITDLVNLTSGQRIEIGVIQTAGGNCTPRNTSFINIHRIS